MRQLLVALGAVVAVVAPAAPASSGPVPEGPTTSRSDAPKETPRLLPPELPMPPPDDTGCILPVTSSLEPCPAPEDPPVSCVLPVTEPLPEVVVPDVCRTPRRPPEGRVVPLLPAATR